MVVALLALVLAMGGNAVATEVGLNAKQKRQVKVMADQQIESKAALLTVGRSKTGSCDPSSAAFVNCGTVSLNLPRNGRVLITATAGFDGDNSAAGYRGDCRLTADATVVGADIANGAAGTGTVQGVGFNANNEAGTSLTAITAPLPAGTHDLALTCNQGGGEVEFPTTSISAVMIGSGLVSGLS